MSRNIFKLIVLISVMVSCTKNYQITESNLKKHIKYLASDELEGRLAGTKSSAQAGDYIKKQFKSSNIEALNGNYSEKFDFKIRFKEWYNDSIASTQNIIAFVEGNDPKLKNEYIIVGAHFDHLGFGGKTTSSKQKDTLAIHNGADDNASGVTSVIELAKKFNQEKTLKRSLIFVAFGAEEQGLHGSRYFIKSHPEIIKKACLMINFDMIGRLRNKRKMGIGGTGTAKDLSTILRSSIDTNQVKTFFDPNGKGGSDHHFFYMAGVPVLFFHTGGHPDYHAPGDDYEKINYIGLKHINELVVRLIEKVGNREQKLEYICLEDKKKNDDKKDQ
jgi:Zn-dependent M28 family amino/carboxypeptidase